SASRSIRRSAETTCSRSAIGSATGQIHEEYVRADQRNAPPHLWGGLRGGDPVHGVLAVVVHLGRVLVPEGSVAASRNLLRAEHHVVDAVLPNEAHPRRVPGQILPVVGAFLDVVREPI